MKPDCRDRYLHNILKEYSGEEHPGQPIEDQQLKVMD
jgi:hypothetical protein